MSFYNQNTENMAVFGCKNTLPKRSFEVTISVKKIHWVIYYFLLILSIVFWKLNVFWNLKVHSYDLAPKLLSVIVVKYNNIYYSSLSLYIHIYYCLFSFIFKFTYL